MPRDTDSNIDDYLRQRLMPVEGTIPQIPGIEMYGNSIPAGIVGGDLFEYINFEQRYDLDARIERALTLSKEYLEPLPEGAAPRNSVDDHVTWLKLRPDYTRSEEHTSELQSLAYLVCRLLLVKKLPTSPSLSLISPLCTGATSFSAMLSR